MTSFGVHAAIFARTTIRGSRNAAVCRSFAQAWRGSAIGRAERRRLNRAQGNDPTRGDRLRVAIRARLRRRHCAPATTCAISGLSIAMATSRHPNLVHGRGASCRGPLVALVCACGCFGARGFRFSFSGCHGKFYWSRSCVRAHGDRLDDETGAATAGHIDPKQLNATASRLRSPIKK